MSILSTVFALDAHQSRRHYGRVFDYRWSARKFGQDYYYRSSSRAVLALLTYHDVVSNTNHYGGFTFLYLRT